MRRLWLAVLLLAACDDATPPSVDAGAPPRDAGAPVATVTLRDLVDEMSDLDGLARVPFPAYRTHQASSWDRRSDDPTDPSDFDGWYANRDWGWFEGEVEIDGRTERILAEAEGAGAIMRLWTADPMGTVRVYLDDLETPALEYTMESLTSESNPTFGAPFGYVVARGANLYFPIPFAERMRVTTDAPEADPGLYYHLDYRLYVEPVQVEPWSEAAMADAADAVERARERLNDPSRIVTGEPRALTLPATIDADGGAVIRQLTIRAPGATEEALRSSVLVMTFDGVEAVRAPVGDFFGTAPGLNALSTLALAVTEEGALVSRLPMPFATEATIAIEGALAPEAVEVVIDDWDFDARSQHLHAGWGSTGVVESQPKRDLQIVELTGPGTYVGMHLVVVNPIDEWWGEGDEKIYVDGDATPTWFGTGTEDYFGYAYTDLALFSAPYHAQTRTGLTTQAGHVSNMRVHVLDPIPFSSSFDFDLELWAWVPSEIALHWVTWWYTRDGVDDYAPLGAGEAQVLDPATLRR